MMKKILIVLSVCMVLMTGCSSTKEPPVALPEEPADTAGEKTVLYCGEKVFPLSFTVDGAQKIENGTYWYYELAEDYGKEWEESFYTYSEGLELNGSHSYGDFGKRCRYATNGDWALFLSPVHTEYNEENQANVDAGLMKMAKQQLTANKMKNAASVITDVWLCDFDGDKEQEKLFLATDDKSYCYLGYVKNDICQVFDGTFSVAEGEELPKLSPAVCDLDGNGQWSLLLHKDGDYESLAVFDYSAGNFTKCYEVIF